MMMRLRQPLHWFTIAVLLTGFPLAAMGATQEATRSTQSLPETQETAPAPPEAGGQLGWVQAIRTGLARHPELLAAQHEVLKAEAVTGEVESVLYPTIRGIAANSGGNTRTLVNLNTSGSLPKPTNYLTTQGLRLDYLITDFGHTTHSILASKALASSAEKRASAAKALVILDVQQAYLQSLKNQQLVEIAEAVLKEREVVRQQAEAFYRRELRSKLDLDFATLEVSRAELHLVRARNDVKIAFAALNNAMGLENPVASYQLEAISLDIKPAGPIELLLEAALRQRPELMGAKDRETAAAEAFKAAKARRFGEISTLETLAHTFWARQERPSGKDVSNNHRTLGWWGASVASSFPFYTGGRITGEIDEAKAHTGEAEATTRLVANELVLQVARSYFELLTAEQQIEVSRRKVAVAHEAFQLASQRFKAGLGSILDVTTAATDLARAERELAEAEYGYRLAEVALAYATGAEYSRY